MAVVNNHPAMGYFDNTNNDLKYIRADNPTSVTLRSLTAHPGPNVGLWAALLAGLVVGLAGKVARRKIQ
jgi:hypothetical protein